MPFPVNPSNGTTYTFNGTVYTWDGSNWTFTEAGLDKPPTVTQIYGGPFSNPFNPAEDRSGRGGYEFTGAFTDRGTPVNYTQALVDAGRWQRFGFSTAAQLANDVAYWPEDRAGFVQAKGLFGGLSMPEGVTDLYSFDDTQLGAGVTTGNPGDLQYTAADGTILLRDCKVGDYINVRFDVQITPQIANTTVEFCLIFATRDSDNNATFTFPLTGDPQFYGTGTVGRTFLTRPVLTAYIASQEDINCRALPAIRADNPIIIEPITLLTTVIR